MHVVHEEAHAACVVRRFFRDAQTAQSHERLVRFADLHADFFAQCFAIEGHKNAAINGLTNQLNLPGQAENDACPCVAMNEHLDELIGRIQTLGELLDQANRDLRIALHHLLKGARIEHEQLGVLDDFGSR